MKKTRLLIILPLLFLLLIPASVLAFEVKKGDVVYVAEDEVIEGNLYVAGSSITIDGKVNGDIYCAGQSIAINGEVAGDVMCAGSSIVIDGKILGSARVAGQTIMVKNEIDQNLMAFGTNIILDKNASVGWEMLAVGALAEIRGRVDGDLHGGAQRVIVSGEIGKNVKISTGNKKQDGLIIEDSAQIGGDLVYTDFFTGSISDKAVILGETIHNLPPAKTEFKLPAIALAWKIIFSIFSSLAVGLVLISLWNKQMIEAGDKMLSRTGASIGWGALLMIAVPILALVLMLTLIGAKLAFILLGVWLIFMCVAKILASLLLGRYLLKKNKNKEDSLIWPLVLGVALAQIIFSIPVLGWLLSLIAVWWGLGGLFLYFRKA